jgi:AcrR family transcriptional regulator
MLPIVRGEAHRRIRMAERKGRRKEDHRTRVGQERSARMEARILEAALRVFGEMGPDAPKIDDFVTAAGISRGTFYNYFQSVEELLAAISRWSTRDVVERVDRRLREIDDPAVRLGVGVRLFLAHAQADRTWCRFVARVWDIDGIERPVRDLDAGVRRGVFRVPSVTVARDLVLGTMREALRHLGAGRTEAKYADQVAEICLQALGVDARRIATVLRHDVSEPKEAEEDQG